MAFSGVAIRLTPTHNSGGGAYDVPFDVEEFDTDNYWAIGNPTRFVAPVTGFYMAGGFVGVSTGAPYHARLVPVVGGVPQNAVAVEYVAGSDIDKHYNLSALVQLSVGDYMKMQVEYVGNIAVAAGRFWMWRVG